VQDPDPSPKRSPSPEKEETDCFHDKFFEFVVQITGDPFGPKKLPEKFSQFLAGQSSPARS
jgi:hypothetical protein